MANRVIREEVDQEESRNYSFLIQKLFAAIFRKASVTKADYENVMNKLNEEITGRPFRVAVIGQSGVGKSSTLNHVFGLNLPTSDIEEGTTEVIEKIFPMRDGFDLSIFDMPGLLQSRKKDAEYMNMYKEILPKCDVIVYIIKANTRNIGDDCKILKEMILPICNSNAIMDNLIIAVNKVDIIGESYAIDDPDYMWDSINNQPTTKLVECIRKKREDIYTKFIDENLVLLNSDNALKPEQVVFYSATYDYNLKDVLMAITNAGKRGFIYMATVGFDRFIGK